MFNYLKKITLLIISILSLALSADELPINESNYNQTPLYFGDIPAGFEDWGSSTFQSSVNLEWLDVTLTQYRSYLDLQADITDAEVQYYDYFNKSEGWRYATREEFQALVSEWFGINFEGRVYDGAPFDNQDSLIVEKFIHTFGDTQDSYLDLRSSGKTSSLNISLYGSGAVQGILATSPPNKSWKKYIGLVGDMEIVDRETGAYHSDADDLLLDIKDVSVNKRIETFGSFLVRTPPN
jgi:hypothetical protein